MTSYRTTPAGIFGRWLLAALFVLSPPALWADPPPDPPPEEIDEYDEDPIIIVTPTLPSGEATTTQTFLCQIENSAGSVDCAAEIRLDEPVTGELSADGGELFFLRLTTHEAVAFETFSGSDTFGELTNVRGDVLARDDDGGRGRNFRIRAMLAPGEYFLRIAAVGGAEGRYTLVAGQDREGSPVGGPMRACHSAVEIGAFATIEGSLDRPGGVDVYVVHANDPGDWLIEVDGAVRYELKAADCATSLGLGDASLGATLRSLPRGGTFLYLSPSDNASGGAYRVRVEPR